MSTEEGKKTKCRSQGRSLLRELCLALCNLRGPGKQGRQTACLAFEPRERAVTGGPSRKLEEAAGSVAREVAGNKPQEAGWSKGREEPYTRF